MPKLKFVGMANARQKSMNQPPSNKPNDFDEELSARIQTLPQKMLRLEDLVLEDTNYDLFSHRKGLTAMMNNGVKKNDSKVKSAMP